MFRRPLLAAVLVTLAVQSPVWARQAPAPRAVTFDEAITQALARNLTVAEAAQAILRAEALLQEARIVYRPTVAGTVTTTVLDEERGFDDLVTQPQTQSLFGASVSFPILAASRWAAKVQAEDQVEVARLSVGDVRQQIGVATAEAYLAVIAQKRQVDVNVRARDNAQAHVEYATARLEAGAGSKLNELRASQQLATDEVLIEAARLALVRAQEALGVLVSADTAVDTAGEPAFEVPPPPATDAWLEQRTDVQLFSRSVEAAERVVADSWKDWIPTGTVAFEPQYVTPAGLFQPSNTWRAVVQFAVPIFDGGERSAIKRQREVERDTLAIQLDQVELRARSQLRVARAAVEISERAVANARLAAQHAAEVVRITDIAFRAGATTNLEVIDAQRVARDADTAAAQAEDRVRQARLDLLVALGRFPN